MPQGIIDVSSVGDAAGVDETSTAGREGAVAAVRLAGWWTRVVSAISTGGATGLTAVSGATATTDESVSAGTLVTDSDRYVANVTRLSVRTAAAPAGT